MFEHKTQETRAWILHPDIKRADKRRDAVSAIHEAISLAEALPNLTLYGSEIVSISKVRPGTLFGTGKIDEIGQVLSAEGVELVLIDGALTPVQQRNLEKAWDVKILDRTGLILEIFSDRARTGEGRLQVEMAALSYQRTRLVRAWTHLERQRGGLGFVGGPGETQIEADRRAIDVQILALRRQLDKVVKTRGLHRAGRAKVPFPIVAFVGYTNAGKSTLFNHMTGADVFAKDMLFATLDPTMRKVELPSGDDVILSDTVGFISELPTQLVAAFRATLEEVLDADLVVHVRDITHDDTQAQADDVRDILARIGVKEDTLTLDVWNKIDLLDNEDMPVVLGQAERAEDTYAISAQTGEGLPALFDAMSEKLSVARRRETLNLTFAQGAKRAWLFDQGVVLSEEQGEKGYVLNVEWTDRQLKNFQRLK